jgi:hypothetical protein
MAQKIRVIRDDGTPFDFPVLVLRNFLRAVDNFPFVPLIGGLVMLIDRDNRRLGDLAASTVVVDDIPIAAELPEPGLPVSAEIGERSLSVIPAPGVRLNENQLELIRDFLLALDGERSPSPEAADVLARKVAEALGIEIPESGSNRRFLEEVFVLHALPD